jgi:IS5 family transposase
MRRVHEEQTYLDFNQETSLNVVRDYRAKYAWIDESLDANPLILWLVHEDLESLSESKGGREAKYTSEILFRALIVHQIEKTSLRETIVRIAESPTLQSFIRLGMRPVPDFTFLNRAFKAITAETWKLINEELAGYAVKECKVNVSQIRVDSTVIESNIHYPTDSSLLWDSYRVLSRLLCAVRAEKPELCPHRFHDRKVKKDLVYVNRYMRSKSRDRQREMLRRFRRLHDSVLRLQDIAAPLPKALVGSDNLALLALGQELTHYLPLTRTVCRAAERAVLKGETVPASDRVFSIFEEHAELIKRGKSNKPVEFGHTAWLAQSRSKFITDYDVMEEKIPDADLLADITERHKAAFRKYPDGITADTGFRAPPEEMTGIKARVATVAVPGRGQSRAHISAYWHHFRAGIEGSISVLKRAFRLSICMYRGFKSFAASVGMAVFCHNLVNLAPKRAPT